MLVAGQLEQWDYTADAASYAERASRLPGNGLDISLWSKIMVRARKLDVVLTRSGKLTEPAIVQTGEAIRTYYTPEEKAVADAAIRKAAPPRELALAENAEFTDLQSDLLNDRLLHDEPNAGTEGALVTLETRRGRFAELAKALEPYAQRNISDPQAAFRAMAQAENAWRAAGDRTAELRVLAAPQSPSRPDRRIAEPLFRIIGPGAAEPRLSRSHARAIRPSRSLYKAEISPSLDRPCKLAAVRVPAAVDQCLHGSGRCL